MLKDLWTTFVWREISLVSKININIICIVKFFHVFIDDTTSKHDFTGELGEREKPVRRNTFTKLEGDMSFEETTSKSEYHAHQTVDKVQITRHKDNLTVGEGRFEVK